MHDGQLSQAPRVVVVGGGFAGLNAARVLADTPVRVTLIDRQNYHLFQPLLYQVATAELSAGDIAVPLRSVLQKAANVDVLLGEVEAVDVDQRQVRLADGTSAGYDYLILATGVRHAYFGHPDWEALAPGLKSIEDAIEIRNRGLLALERAERATDAGSQEALLTYVVVGGGPTGVELAGALAEVERHTVAHEFRHVDPRRGRVLLLEGGPRILAGFPADLSRRAQRTLERLGVQVRASTRVTRLSPSGVYVGDEFIPARTIYWAAGVAPSGLGRTLGAPLDHAGHVLVAPDLSLPGHPEVLVVGDLASFVHQTGKPLPGVAQVAIQQGRAAADNVLRSVRRQPRRRFHYRDRGNLAVIGRGAAVADLRLLHLSGFPAWLVWAGVHIFYLISFERRLLVMLQWAWSYLTNARAARLITYPWRPGGAKGETAEREGATARS